MMIRYAMALLGTPYRWGGDDPIYGFDCSGLIQELLGAVGMKPKADLTAQGLYQHFKFSSRKDVRAIGALVFYGQDIEKINHVAMMVSENQIIEAGGGGSKTTSLDLAAQQNAWVRIRRIDNRKDLVAILMPDYK